MRMRVTFPHLDLRFSRKICLCLDTSVCSMWFVSLCLTVCLVCLRFHVHPRAVCVCVCVCVLVKSPLGVTPGSASALPDARGVCVCVKYACKWHIHSSRGKFYPVWRVTNCFAPYQRACEYNFHEWSLRIPLPSPTNHVLRKKR